MNKIALSLILILLSFASHGQDLKDVLKENQELFTSFFDKDQAKVAKEAGELAELLKKSKSSDLKAVKDKLSALNKINKKNSKEKNLEHYAEFIKPLVKVVKEKKPENYEIFYCPMVEKRWIQNLKIDKDVKNVFAQYMLKCGEKDS